MMTSPLLADLIPRDDEWIPFVLCLVIFGVLGLLLLLVIVGTVLGKGKWGINFLQI
jgi:hypothetical protein